MPTLPFQILPPNISQCPGRGPRTDSSPRSRGEAARSAGVGPIAAKPCSAPFVRGAGPPETCFPEKGEGTEAPGQEASYPSRHPPELPSTQVPWRRWGQQQEAPPCVTQEHHIPALPRPWLPRPRAGPAHGPPGASSKTMPGRLAPEDGWAAALSTSSPLASQESQIPRTSELQEQGLGAADSHCA